MSDPNLHGKGGHSGGHSGDYEKQEFAAGGVLISLAILGVLGVITYFIVLGMFRFLNNYEAKQQAKNPMVADQAETRKSTDDQVMKTFPAPRLQRDDVAEMHEQLVKEEQTLHSYAWVDQNAGTVRIPIDRAMELIAERGLPGRSVAPAAPAQGAPAAKKAVGKKKS